MLDVEIFLALVETEKVIIVVLPFGKIAQNHVHFEGKWTLVKNI